MKGEIHVGTSEIAYFLLENYGLDISGMSTLEVLNEIAKVWPTE